MSPTPPSQPSMFSAFFPPAPTLTSLPAPITGRVVIITGAASGIGLELAKILYHAGATVYIGARSPARCDGAKKAILASPNTNPKHGTGIGKVENMVMDLADMKSVKAAVGFFLARQTRLDLLVNNAGVMVPPKEIKDVDGRDLTISTNTLAPFLLTSLLSPILALTASTAPKDSVRVVFVTSLLQVMTPAEVMTFDKDGMPCVREKDTDNYAQSKVGCAWLAVEFGKRLAVRDGDGNGNGVICVSLHPGIVLTELQRHFPAPARAIIRLIMKPQIYGAYSELYAAFSPDITSADTGGYAQAWGRKSVLPENVLKGVTDGKKEALLRWCEREVGGLLL